MTFSPVKTSLDPIELSVVLPCYNENTIIEGIVREWHGALRDSGTAFEMIVVNDGSLDGTIRVLDRLRKEIPELRVLHQLKSGHALACRRGYEMAKGRYILSVDSNGRYEPSDFRTLWEKRDGQVLVLGHRTHRLDNLISRAFTATLRLIAKQGFGCPLQDPNISFRLFLRDPGMRVLKELPRHWDSLGFTQTVLLFREFPGQTLEEKIPYRHRANGRSRLGLWSYFQLVTQYLMEASELRWSLAKQKPLKGPRIEEIPLVP